MLAFSVAVRPYEEGRAIASLLCNVLSYGLFIGGNSIDDWRIKEGSWWARSPLPILLGELELVQVAKYTGHGDVATSPWLAKVEFKFVVLHENVAGDRILRHMSKVLCDEDCQTYASDLTSAQMLSDGFGNCWFLSHAQYLSRHATPNQDVLSLEDAFVDVPSCMSRDHLGKDSTSPSIKGDSQWLNDGTACGVLGIDIHAFRASALPGRGP